MHCSRPDIRCPLFQEPQFMKPQTPMSRLDDMLERYGECCTQAKAARILSKSTRTITRMLDDGRLRRVETSVDVRSIVEYLERPKEINHEVRVQKKSQKTVRRWDNFARPK